ncbi:tetratricopeptide repeat protein [Borreliella burgdorferi]|uniref:LMP1 n=1 Tax=Borreliella burgdorferi TaxID=139 RepID=Q9AHK4_BORBG|nr:tetratricopeptide repeat protein [Borreliella burgdorferi]AAK18803.1 LMP1 [Borreliella burgdorferi N40]ADQ29216.1 Surface-located membrane protein 1 (LMP1) [Borreliella burgdorferi N40]PRR15154.1 cell surface protein [Borreliella burgdorferi]PRR28991.1 cell surface protein [Borreliella burgdorferi]PRR41237.1 cell surface protein [Borreliella burgdorferi]
MNKKHTNFSVLLLLIFLLILSFGGFGYYIYQSKLNDKNREIMLNEVKNSVIDRNYKKAYSVAKLLQDKYPQNEDIAMLTNTLAEIANSSPFESKDLQRDSANQILDKIKGQDNTKTNVNENFDIAFNNRYIKDSTITENYSDRNDDVGIEDEDISEFKKSKIPEKIKPNTNPKEEDQIIQSPNPKLSVNDQKNLFNLEKLKKNLSGKSNSENILNNSQKIENDKQNTNLSKEKNSENILKTPDNSKYSNNNNTTSLKKIPSNSQKESELSPPSQTIIGKIYRPYSYLIKKELYEILDDINTGRVTLGKNRLKELIKKGLSNKFQKVNELIENSKNKEASNLLLTLIKKDIEPNLINIPKDPYKKEIFQLDKEDKNPQHPGDLKSKVHSIKPIDLENTKSRQQAIKDLNEFLKNNPNDAQASKTLAQANKIQHLEDLKSKVHSIKPIDLENTKSRQQAIKDLNEFLKNNPNDAQASKTLAQAYENNGDLLKAENAYEKIIKLTNTQEDHYKLGIIRFKLKKYEHSIESFDQTIKLDPKHKKALHNKGIALMMLNKNKKAIESFEKAIQIDKNYGTAYYQKGIAEEKNGDMQQAFASFKNAYNLDKNPNYALKAGIVSNNLGNFKQSEEYLNFFNANAKKPNEIAIYNLSIAKFENNKLEESLETINKAIDLNPEKSEYLYLKASINLKKENYQNAISLYSLVIEKNPENTSAYINLAKAYEKSGNKSQAISTLEKIINKNNKLALNNLGILYKKEKNYQKAIEIFEKAIINSDIEAKYNLATTLIEINDNTRAKDLLREYTKLKPNNPEALHALGIIEYNENNNDQTLRELIKKFPNYKKNENIKKIIGI